MRFLLVAALIVASCGGTPASSILEVPTHGDPTPPSATGADATAFAQEACRGAAYVRCVDSMLTVLAIADPGQLVAICDYEGGEGDIVFIDAEADAEDECSGGGLFAPSSVANVVEVP